MPAVSILIPTYNYAHYIGEAIDSALAQTFTDFEIIIVDDQSKDNTDEVVQKYLTDPRITYLKNEKNLGLTQNFNRCLELANGKYIKFLLADDKLHPQLLEKFVPVMEQNPKIKLITSNRETFGNRVKKRILPLTYLQPGKTVIYETLREKNGNWIGEPTTVMFRTDDIQRVGKFNPDYTVYVDWEMWLRLLNTGDCYIVPETLSYFRTHEKQASQVLSRNFNYTFEDYRFYKEIQQRNPYQLDLSQIYINDIVRKKATYCAKVFYRTLPSIFNKKQRHFFKQAFQIGIKENVLFAPITSFFTKKK